MNGSDVWYEWSEESHRSSDWSYRDCLQEKKYLQTICHEPTPKFPTPLTMDPNWPCLSYFDHCDSSNEGNLITKPIALDIHRYPRNHNLGTNDIIIYES